MSDDSTHSLGQLRACLRRGTCVEGRRRVVLQGELNRRRDIAVEQLAEERESEIQSGGDAASGDPVAVDDHALVDRDRSEQREFVL
ncbi:MAG: hypothetical protein ACRCSN_20395 [Dermatophilaceae bacterium]